MNKQPRNLPAYLELDSEQKLQQSMKSKNYHNGSTLQSLQLALISNFGKVCYHISKTILNLTSSSGLYLSWFHSLSAYFSFCCLLLKSLLVFSDCFFFYYRFLDLLVSYYCWFFKICSFLTLFSNLLG